MTAAGWELMVGLSSSRGRNDRGVEGLAVIGDVSGETPISPVDVTVYAGESRVEVNGAELQQTEVLGPTSVAMFLPGLGRGMAPRGSIIRPRAAGAPEPPPPDSELLFGRRRVALSALHRVVLAPDYGGALFSTDGGMAPIDAFAPRIPGALQAALRLWYDDWDEATSTGRWTLEEWVAEGHRLAAELQAAMGADFDIYFDPR